MIAATYDLHVAKCEGRQYVPHVSTGCQTGNGGDRARATNDPIR